MNKAQAKEVAVLGALRLRGASSAKELCESLGISQATFSRQAKNLSKEIIILGQGKSTRYALRREARGLGRNIPVCRVSSKGEVEAAGSLIPLQPRGYAYVSEEKFIIHDGLPYFLSDLAPQGYLGRSFPLRYPELGLPEQLKNWSNEDCLEAIARRGEDSQGNLVVGQESFARWQAARHSSVHKITMEKRSKVYPQAVESALAGVLPASSAGGEQPKFMALVETPQGLRHKLIKFSPNIHEPIGRRWGDLLIGEQIALALLAENGVPAAESEILESEGRIFLEVTRFDRIGQYGRRGLISLEALDNEFFGHLSGSWISASTDLLGQGSITEGEAKLMRLLDSFGALIANTDRHFGNISFFWEITKGKLSLAPAYDMLPMLYAPENGQIIGRSFQPSMAEAAALKEWKSAFSLAKEYWLRVSRDKRISAVFRNIAKTNQKILAGA